MELRPGGPFALLAVLIAGCAGAQHHKLQSADVAQASLVTTAQQRVIVTFPPAAAASAAADRGSRRIVCAEPSPDVAQAISSAIEAGLKVDLGKAIASDTAKKDIGFNFGQSSSASIAQLGERLAVVQLLRDKMYRACEAYANGAIKEAAYTLLLARNDKSMMSLLSNELAAGAFGRALAVAGGQSSTGAVDQKALDEQQDKTKKAAASFKTVATTADAKKEDVDKAGATLDAEIGKLVALERRLNTQASSTAQITASGLTGPTRSSDVSKVAEIHQSFIDDDGVDPLIDACIIGVERLASDDPEARKYIQDIKIRQDEALKAARSASAELDNLAGQRAGYQSDFDRFSVQLSRLDKNAPDFAARLERLQLDQSQAAAYVSELDGRITSARERRAEALKTPGLKPEDLYLASGSPFAAFCFQSVLAGDSKFMNVRMKQKRMLRGLEFSDEAMAVKRVDLCSAALKADKATIDDATRKGILATCKAPDPETAIEEKRLELCLATVRADKGSISDKTRDDILASCARPGPAAKAAAVAAAPKR